MELKLEFLEFGQQLLVGTRDRYMWGHLCFSKPQLGFQQAPSLPPC